MRGIAVVTIGCCLSLSTIASEQLLWSGDIVAPSSIIESSHHHHPADFSAQQQADDDDAKSHANKINPARSAGGVTRISITPVIEQESLPALPGCKDVTYDGVEIAYDSLLWPWHGLQDVARQVYDSYNHVSKQHERTLKFKDSRKFSSVAAGAVGGAQSSVLDSATMCTARRMLLNNLPFSESVCSCLSTQTPELYCQWVDAFSLNVHCHDNMADAVAKKKHEFCPSLLSEAMGMQYSSMCSGWLAGGISTLNLDLYALNVPSLPNEVDAGIAAQESRAYYLSYKAVEKLTKWTDAHLFCDDDASHPRLQDLEILPTWKSEMYLYIDTAFNKKLPIGVVSVRNDEHVLVVIRNIRTTFEAALFLSNRFSRKFQSFEHGTVHAGYDAVATPIVQVVGHFLSKFFESKSITHPRVTLIGHGNFGAGIAAIISRDLASAHEKTAADIPIEHNLIVFEAGPVGDFEFIDDLRKKVNARNIVSDRSGFVDMPCKTTGGCDASSQVKTGLLGERIGPFLPLPGRVTVDSENLADDVWRTSATSLEVVANMACSAPCWLTTKFCSDDPSPRCSFHNCGAFITDEAKNSVLI